MTNKLQLKEQIIQKAWEDPAFKQKLLSDPKAALQDEFNIIVPEDINLVVIEETSSTFGLVIPQSPAQVLSLNESDEQLGRW
ncbi:NHLP leader peptide family RiPP precursor [Paenibacillus marinisediminis]